MKSLLVQFPATITAGLGFQAAVTAAEYPAPDWVVTAHLRGPAKIDIPGSPAGTAHAFAVDATATAAWLPGDYWFSLRAARGSDVVEVGTGRMEVLRDLVAADTFDGRSDNEKALDAIDAVIGRRATMDQERYTINNRELWRTPIADLLKLRGYYAAAVRRERDAAAGRTGFGRKVLVRFS